MTAVHTLQMVLKKSRLIYILYSILRIDSVPTHVRSGVLTVHYTVKNVRDSWICFDQTLLGLGPGKLFPARESLVCDILAGDRNPLNLFLHCSLSNLSVLCIVAPYLALIVNSF